LSTAVIKAKKKKCVCWSYNLCW